MSARAIWSLLAALELAVGPRAFADTPSANRILARSVASYDALKTYQGTLTIVTEIGGSHEKLILKMKAVNGGDGKIARSVGVMNHTSTGHGALRSATEKQIDDGVTVFTVMMDLKQYSKRPHAPEKISELFVGALGDIEAAEPRLGVATIRVHGERAYELSSKAKDGELQIVVDKATYHLRSIRKWRSHGNGRSSLTLTASDERFNETVPEDSFKWSVPPGFTESVGVRPNRPRTPPVK